MTSLTEYAKTTPVKGICTFCKNLLPPELLPEVNDGALAGLTPKVIHDWLKAEHGLDIPMPMIGNHIRGLRNVPERHQ